MSDLSSTEENRILTEWVDANTVWLGIHETDEGNDPDGTTEFDATDYDRQALNAADVTISGGGPTTLTNDADIVFTESADSEWGEADFGVLWDSETGGDPRSSAVSLTNGGTVSEGIEFKIEAGDLTFDLD